MEKNNQKPSIFFLLLSFSFIFTGLLSIFFKFIYIERSGFEFEAKGWLAVVVGLIFFVLGVSAFHLFYKIANNYFKELFDQSKVVKVKMVWFSTIFYMIVGLFVLSKHWNPNFFDIFLLFGIGLVFVSMGFTSYLIKNVSKK